MDLVKWVQGNRRDLGSYCVRREQELRLPSLENRKFRGSHLKCLMGEGSEDRVMGTN